MECSLEPPFPANECERIQALQEYLVLDSLPEKAYDDIVKLAAHICNAPIALISFVDSDRQWFKAREGTDLVQTPRSLSFCAYALNQAEPLIIEDATADERFRNNSLVTGEPYIRFYAGVQLIDSNGYALGTICVLDHKSRTLSNAQLEALAVLSRQTMSLLEMARQQRHLERVLDEQRKAQVELHGLNTVLTNSLEGISRLDVDGRYVTANVRYAAACGFTPDEMRGMEWQITVHPDERERMMQVYAEMLKSGRVETETVGVRKDASIFYKHVIMVPFYDDNSQVAGHYCFMRDITRRKMMERRLAKGAYHDALTDLPNRASILERLDDAVARQKRRPDYCFALLFLDLDDFKPVNDQYGHAAGDHVLIEVAERIKSCIRTGDVAARIGGDEFLVLLDDIVSPADAREVADRIQEAMAAPIFYNNSSIQVGISIGITVNGEAASASGADLLKRADEAMYRNKQERKTKNRSMLAAIGEKLKLLPVS